MNLGAPEILIALLVIALLFGGAKLPKLARSLGSAKGEFEKGMKDGEKLSEEAKKNPSSDETTSDTTTDKS
jgi:sec-independent protein translocase protein TatA